MVIGCKTVAQTIYRVSKKSLTTLNLNDLKSKFRLPVSAYMKTRNLYKFSDTRHDARTIFYLKSYKQNKLSGLIPIFSWFIYLHIPTHGSLIIIKPNYCLQVLLFVLIGHLLSYKKWFCLVVSYLHGLFYLYLAKDFLWIFTHNALHCCCVFTLFCWKSVSVMLYCVLFAETDGKVLPRL